VRLEGLGQLKNPMTSLRIESATFRLVAYCLNQLRYREPIGSDTRNNSKTIVISSHLSETQANLYIYKSETG
jgi:hypothetical protein